MATSSLTRDKQTRRCPRRCPCRCPASNWPIFSAAVCGRKQLVIQGWVGAMLQNSYGRNKCLDVR